MYLSIIPSMLFCLFHFFLRLWVYILAFSTLLVFIFIFPLVLHPFYFIHLLLFFILLTYMFCITFSLFFVFDPFGIDQANEVTSIYCSNFPDHISLAKFYGRFSEFGDVVEVSLPCKRNKVGAHFGLVCFKNAKNLHKLQMKLNGVWFDNFKLRSHVVPFSNPRVRGSRNVNNQPLTSHLV